MGKFLGLSTGMWIAIIVVFTLVTNAGYIAIGPFQSGWLSKALSGNPAPVGSGSVTTVSGVVSAVANPPTSGPGFILYPQIQDAFTGADLHASNVKMDIMGQIGGVWNLAKPLETISYAAAGQASTGLYAPGTPLLFHVSDGNDPTNGDDYYDEWYACTVQSGGQCFDLRPADTYGGTSAFGATGFTSVGGLTLYQVPLSPNISVGQTTSAGYEWILPIFTQYGVAGTSSVTIKIQNPDGSAGTAWTGSANTYSAQGSQGSVTYTAASKTPQLNIFVTVTNSKLTWGRPTIVLSSQTPYNPVVLYASALVAVNSTSLRLGVTTASGWVSVSTQPAGGGWTVVAAPLPSQNGIAPAYYTVSSQVNLNFPVPLDTTSISSSTKLGIAVYMGDLQYVPDSLAAVPDAAPTGYGAIAATGLSPDTIIPAQTYATSASGGINNGSNVPSRTTVVWETISTN